MCRLHSAPAGGVQQVQDAPARLQLQSAAASFLVWLGQYPAPARLTGDFTAPANSSVLARLALAGRARNRDADGGSVPGALITGSACTALGDVDGDRILHLRAMSLGRPLRMTDASVTMLQVLGSASVLRLSRTRNPRSGRRSSLLSSASFACVPSTRVRCTSTMLSAIWWCSGRAPHPPHTQHTDLLACCRGGTHSAQQSS